MTLLRKTFGNFNVNGRQSTGEVVMFWCPGCKTHMWFAPGVWKWNGDEEKPTVSPSILSSHGDHRCHLFMRDGKLKYLPDCTHELAGKTVPMEAGRW